MCKLLLENGFIEKKGEGKGSHKKFINPQNGKMIIVPYHNKELGIGLKLAILKQTGLK
jgi:predicted RNA binding protein YcfA (HicA-like mRNA interferase family)